MARTDLTKTNAPGSYASAGQTITFEDADTTNKNQFTMTGNELVIAHNTDASSQTVTITSSNDPYGRTGDIAAESIAAGELKIFGPFDVTGWIQSDGKLYLEASSSLVKFAVIKL